MRQLILKITQLLTLFHSLNAIISQPLLRISTTIALVQIKDNSYHSTQLMQVKQIMQLNATHKTLHTFLNHQNLTQKCNFTQLVYYFHALEPTQVPRRPCYVHLDWNET